MITYDEFAKLELMVATILSAEKVEGSEKLLKIKLSLGDPSGLGASEERQIISGIAKSYLPESLVGQQVVIIANLEPRLIMGLESQGMLLAADSPDGPVVLNPEREVAPGSKIK